MAASNYAAKLAFHKAYNGQPNIMTPHIVRYGWREGDAYEVSTGEGLGRNAAPIFGVTVLRDGERIDYEASACLGSLDEADAYIERGFRQ